jgi:hypothetical protein
MDVLPDVLRVVRLSGAIHFNAEFTRPWAVMTSPPDLLAARLMPGAESITLFHLVTSGCCWITCGKLAPNQNRDRRRDGLSTRRPAWPAILT